MNFQNAPALWFAALALPIIILYLLKIRRREVEISSTLLWRMALRDRQANAPWQKLRRNLLLLLQLVILSAMVLAVARLAFPTRAIATGSAVFLIDGSASMRAVDVAPSRFERALQVAGDLVRGLGTGTRASAVLIGPQPTVLFAGETDRGRALEALEGAQPAYGESDWAAAFSLAAGLAAQEAGEEQVTFVLLSDGGLPAGRLPPLPGTVEYVAIGDSTDNVGITALSARPLPAGDSAELFARITNFGPSERAAQVTILIDEEPAFTEPIRLPPGGSRTLVFTGLPAASARFEARLSNLQSNLPLDPYPVDDAGYAVLVPPQVRSVLLVSQGNLFLERLLLLFPYLQASKTVPDAEGILRFPDESFDLYILDGVLPGGELPSGQLLLIDPPDNALTTSLGPMTAVENVRSTAHPLAQFLDWRDVHVREAQRFSLPSWSEPLLETDEGPLVFLGETGGRRVAVVAFDLHDSDLPLRVAFPILFAGLFDYLAPHGRVENPNGARPGEPVRISAGTAPEQISVTGPAGTATFLEAGEGPLLFTGTGLPGLYTVETGSGQESFAVNAFSDLESAIASAPQVQIGQAEIPTSLEDQVSNREVWGWLVLLALAFLMIEWLAYHRRLGGKIESRTGTV